MKYSNYGNYIEYFQKTRFTIYIIALIFKKNGNTRKKIDGLDFLANNKYI